MMFRVVKFPGLRLRRGDSTGLSDAVPLYEQSVAAARRKRMESGAISSLLDVFV
jgi:hypothetical protein